MIEHLIYPATFPLSPNTNISSNTLSVLSYNVLLPNSQDGWWNYKMYNPPLNDLQLECSTWSYRSALLRDKLGMIQADVVCLQEVAPVSFESDFDFMEELGYDQCEMFKKGRFRPATFWKSSRVRLVTEPVHRDRTLLTTFQFVVNNYDDDHSKDDTVTHRTENNWHVLNCHLQAGKQGGRRVRQIHEGVSAVTKLAKRLNERDDDPTNNNPLLIVCGDFNGGDECGAVRLLEDGRIGPDFIEDGEPVVKSKEKILTTSNPLIDVSALIKDKREPPETLVVSELISLMVHSDTSVNDNVSHLTTTTTAYDKPIISSMVKERLKRIYQRFASTDASSCKHDDSVEGESATVMLKSDVEDWLVEINGMVGRGSEFRAAAREMGYIPPPPSDSIGVVAGASTTRHRTVLPDDGVLTEQSFIQIYQDELTAGKFWGIAHDLAVLGEPLPDIGVFKARFDRMYCSQALTPCSVLDTFCDIPCPNLDQPSDHLPIAASFRLSSQ